MAEKYFEADPFNWIDDAIADMLSDPKLKGDTLHPDAEGHALPAEKIFRELQSIGYAGL